MNSKYHSIILLIIATTGISFGGLIIRNLDSSDAWQVAFYRGLGFVITIIFILIYRYKKHCINSIMNTSYYGLIGGIFLMIANILFIHAMTITSIGNSLFTVSTIPFITSILAFFFLKEKIEFKTFILMVFAFVGIFIMFKSSIESDDYIGNILAFGCALSFSFFILLIRNLRNIDMMPSSLIGGIFIVIVSYVFMEGNIYISLHDILYCMLWGALLNGFMNSVFIFSTKHLYASEVSFFMLIEFSLGPIWVWLFLDESLRNETLLGGIIVISSLALFSLFQIKNVRTNSKLI